MSINLEGWNSGEVGERERERARAIQLESKRQNSGGSGGTWDAQGLKVCNA